MMGKQSGQIQMVILYIDSMIPEDHILRRIKNCVNFDFIYEKAAPYYSHIGRKSIDLPNKNQKMESDVLIRDEDNVAIIECKSGTFNVANLNDDLIKLQIRNKTKKAYKTLKQVIKYLENTKEYYFKCEDGIIAGQVENPISIHLSMYSMDFIASNVHVMFPEYFENKNPILSMSIEHFFAMIFDAKINNKDIFVYWKKRKRDIQEYPEIYFDNNELDLYYEIVNEDDNTMLAELKRQGILEQCTR